MFCPMCGAPNADDDVYCGNCGASLTADESPAEGSATETVAEEEIFGEPPEDFEEDTPEEELAGPPPDKLPAEPPPSERPKIAQAPPSAPVVPARTGPSLSTSGLALASLVLGIGGLTILPLLGSILAIFFGYMARRDIRSRPSELTGEGLALAGIVMGWIAVGLSVLGLLFVGSIGFCGVCGSLAGSL